MRHPFHNTAVGVLYSEVHLRSRLGKMCLYYLSEIVEIVNDNHAYYFSVKVMVRVVKDNHARSCLLATSAGDRIHLPEYQYQQRQSTNNISAR